MLFYEMTKEEYLACAVEYWPFKAGRLCRTARRPARLRVVRELLLDTNITFDKRCRSPGCSPTTCWPSTRT